METHIDLQQTKKYLAIIAPTGIHTFQTFDDDSERKSPSLAHIIHGFTPENITWMTQLNDKGAGIFMMFNEGDGKGRKACNVVSIRALAIDLDEDGLERLKAIYQQDFPKPRLVIESSPGKFHVYWLLNKPLPLDQFKQCQQMLIKRFGGDPSVNDLPRVLRLPGFIHRKGEPFMVKIHADHPDAPPLDVSWLLSQETSLPSPAAAFAYYDDLLAGLPQPELNACLFDPPPPAAPAQGVMQSANDFLIHQSTPVNVDQLRSAIAVIPAEDRDTWLKFGMALKQQPNIDGYDIWTEWSKTSDKYDPADQRKTWASFTGDHPNPVTVASIFHEAAKYGWQQSVTVSSGEWPEPVPLPVEQAPVKPFDLDLLPTSLKPWVADISHRMQCPPDFVAVTMMTALGSLIGLKVVIRPKANDDWAVVANQWALVVGRPGVMKSPAIEQGLAPLKKYIAKANEEYALESSQYQFQCQAAAIRENFAKNDAKKLVAENRDADLLSVLSVDKPPEPTLKRYLVSDATPEALGELFRQNPNGLLVHRDELVSLIEGLGREDRAGARGFILSGWNGDGSYTFDRIGRGMNLHIPAVCLSLLGGTQPGRLASYVHQAVHGGSGDDGLLQRFGLLVWPDISSEVAVIDQPPDIDAKHKACGAFDYIHQLDADIVGAQSDESPGSRPYLRFDERAQPIFIDWLTQHELRLRQDLHPAIESHLAKYRKLLPGLALIIHLSDKNKGPVSEQAVKKAIAWADYLESHVYRVYGSATQPAISGAKTLLKHLRQGGLPEQFALRDVYRKQWSYLTNQTSAQAAVQLLLEYDWLRENRQGETGGRPSISYMINPRAMNF